MEKFQTDVLIIGGGLAGLSAAIAGSDVKDTKVAIVSKGKIGSSGNTIVSTGCLAGYIKDRIEGDSEDIFAQDILEAGDHINNREMVTTFVEKSGEMLLRLQKYGVNFLQDKDKLEAHSSPGHSFPRVFQAISNKYPYSLQGMAITQPLRKMAKEKGVKFLEGISIYKLIKEKDQITGALGLTKDGQQIVIYAKAIILTTGGCGQIFANNNNTNDITGDSYGLAQSVGANLKDMEFMQFYPTMMVKPFKLAVTTTLFSLGATLLNKERKTFITKYDPKNGHMTTRDRMSRAIFTEIKEGRGIDGGVNLDCSKIPEEKFKENYPTLYNLLCKANINPAKDKIIVTPVAHFFMGGIETNKSGKTNVPGLWAAGEAAGGLHGANRLSSNALTEAVVFGTLAGEDAAQYCQENKYLYSFVFNSGKIIMNPKGDLNLKEIRQNLKEVLWTDVAIVRSEEGLKRAQKKVGEIINNLEYIHTSSSREVISFHELKNSLLTAKSIIRAALLRKESRGAHYRIDYPSKNQL